MLEVQIASNVTKVPRYRAQPTARFRCWQLARWLCGCVVVQCFGFSVPLALENVTYSKLIASMYYYCMDTY